MNLPEQVANILEAQVNPMKRKGLSAIPVLEGAETIRSLIRKAPHGYPDGDHEQPPTTCQEAENYWRSVLRQREHEINRLAQELASTWTQGEAHVRSLAKERDAYKWALEQIAHFDDAHMETARTLHYDMRGWARAALSTDKHTNPGENT